MHFLGRDCQVLCWARCPWQVKPMLFIWTTHQRSCEEAHVSFLPKLKLGSFFIIFLWKQVSFKTSCKIFWTPSQDKKVSSDMSLSSPPIPYVKKLTTLAFPRNFHSSLIQNSLFRTESDLHSAYCSQQNSSVNQSTVPKSISFGRCSQEYHKNRTILFGRPWGSLMLISMLKTPTAISEKNLARSLT